VESEKLGKERPRTEELVELRSGTLVVSRGFNDESESHPRPNLEGSPNQDLNVNESLQPVANEAVSRLRTTHR
jgi:hypothetical protein